MHCSCSKQGDVTITVIGAFCRCVPLVLSGLALSAPNLRQPVRPWRKGGGGAETRSRRGAGDGGGQAPQLPRWIGGRAPGGRARSGGRIPRGPWVGFPPRTGPRGHSSAGRGVLAGAAGARRRQHGEPITSGGRVCQHGGAGAGHARHAARGRCPSPSGPCALEFVAHFGVGVHRQPGARVWGAAGAPPPVAAGQRGRGVLAARLRQDVWVLDA